MLPFADPAEIGGAQAIADVAEYIARLPINPENGLGPGADLAHGAQLYKDDCAVCHGEKGEGDAAKFYPRLAGQHFQYMARPFAAIKSGQRRNSHP